MKAITENLSVVALAVFLFTLPFLAVNASFAWGEEAGEGTLEEVGDEFAGPVLLSDENQTQADETLLAAEDWSLAGTCEWTFDGSVITVRPINDNEVGFFDVRNGLSTVWADYKEQTRKIVFQKTVTIRDCSGLFSGFKLLEEIDGLERVDTSQATSMRHMFSSCPSLVSADFSNLNTSNVTSMYSMFEGCSSLASADFSSFDTSNVTDFSRMLLHCTSIEILDLTSFDVTGAELYRMFTQCSSLREIDISSFSTSGSQKYIFDGCESLTRIAIGEGFTLIDDIPEGSWVNESGKPYTNDSIPAKTAGIYSLVIVSPGWNAFGTCEWLIDDAGCLTIRPANNGNEGVFPYIDEEEPSSGSLFPWIGRQTITNKPPEIAPSIKTARIEGSIKASNSLSRMFFWCLNLEEIIGLENLDTSTVSNMRAMFYGCCSLNQLDLSSFDTSNVEDMSFMFAGADDDYLGSAGPSFTTLDLSSFDTARVINMHGMFWACRKLETIDLSSFNTANVEKMSFMFRGCESLEEVHLSHFDTSNVQSMTCMFARCTSLTNLDLSSFSTSSVQFFSGMFAWCESLETLDLTSFDTSKVISMGRSVDPDMSVPGMFAGCTSLRGVDLSSFDTSNVRIFGGMFEDCSSLQQVDLSNFDTSSAFDMHCMFRGCSLLSKLDLSSFQTCNVSKHGDFGAGGMDGMFDRCSSLRRLDLSSFDTANVVVGGSMPIFDDALCEITVGEKFTLQKEFPQVKWMNTKGQQFYPADIPVGVADTYTSTAPHVSIKVSEGASTALEVGSELQLSVEAFPSTLASSLVWSSSDESVASVDGAGKVTAKAAGTATITVKAGGLSDSITVTVKAAGAPEVAVESVTLDKTSMTLVGQEMRALSATVLPADATYKNVVWSSSDESVARVSAQGSVTAVGKGSATITVRSSDGKKSATCAVEVRNPVTWAGFSSVPIKVCVSKDYGIKVSARGDLPGETDGFTSVAWSSSDSAIAEVTGSGTEGSVKGAAPGSCAIHVSAVRDGKTFDLAEQIEVEWDLIESITLSEASKSIQVGAPGFTLEYGISNPSAAGRLGEIRWSASGIADIQGGNGVLTITPKRTGHEVVALWGPGVSAQFDLTVTPKVVSVSDDSDVEGVLHVNDSETAARVGNAHLRIKDSAEKTNRDLVQLAVGSAGGTSTMLDAYDIDLVDEEGAVVPLEGASDAVTVFAKMGEPIKAVASTHDLGVHYIDAMNGNAEAKNTWVDGEMIAFETTHFSTYAITATQRPAEATNDPVKNDAAVESALAQTGDVMGMVLDGAACVALLGLVSLTILSALRRRWGVH